MSIFIELTWLVNVLILIVIFSSIAAICAELEEEKEGE